MSYSPKLGSAFNKTRLRDPEHPTTCSGMCSVCGECPGLCEIGLADRIEQMFTEELAGAGAVRATLKRYLG